MTDLAQAVAAARDASCRLDELLSAPRVLRDDSEIDEARERCINALDNLLAALDAQAPPAAVPDGYALIPVKLTDEMHCRAVHAAVNSVGAADWPQKVLAALLDAQRKESE